MFIISMVELKNLMEMQPKMAYRDPPVLNKPDQIISNHGPGENYAGTGAWTIPVEPAPINYAFQEGRFLQELHAYIDSTYTAHYGDSKYQATDMIIDAGHGTGFNVGNIMKYAKRYGKKKGYNRADLLKIIHYAIMQLHVHEIENLEGTNEI
jgi:hypothetical protein